MPMKSVTATAPIATSVRCALVILGRRNACTPLAMASTPVSAEQPEANERSTSRTMPAVARSVWETV